MIRYYVIAALVVALALAGWQLRSEIQLNGELQEANRILDAQLEQAITINAALADRVRQLVKANDQLQRDILESEQRKTYIANENARLRDEIDDGIREAPEWAAQPIPYRVADSVARSIAGLYAQKTAGSD